MTWFSPSFPVGSYTYSHGLEYAVEAGYVTDAASLKDWVGHIIGFGTGFLDAVIVAEIWNAIANKDNAAFMAIAERSAANRATREMALESNAQGTAFIDAIGASWHVVGFEDWRSRLKLRNIPLTYPVAVGITAALHSVAQEQIVLAYLHGTVSNLVSAAMRLIPLGQSAGQTVIASLEPAIIDTQQRALETRLENTGTAAPMVDWTSMRHESQYTRLFRS